MSRATSAVGVLVLLGAATAGGSGARFLAWAGDGPEDPLRAHAKALASSSFSVRARAWRTVAATRDAEVLSYLTHEYRRLADPTERGCVVSVVCDAYREPRWLPALRAWRAKNDDPKDAWLWYRALDLEYEVAGPVAVRADAQTHRSPTLRGVAFRVLGAWADPDVPALVVAAAKAGAPSKGVGRAHLVEGWAAALASQPGRLGGAEHRAAVEALLPLLASEDTEARTRLALARGLSRAMRAGRAYFDPRAWKALLDRAEAPPDERYVTPPTPRFFGIEGTGDRIVYVIDASGSMKSALSAGAIEELRGKRPTPPEPGPAPPERPVPPQPPPPDPVETDLPWDRIHTGLDAAVEFAKASIRRLPEEASFAVVLFADKASTLSSTVGLLPATKANVAKVFDDLGRVQRLAGGGTNLHGGLRRAFALASSDDAKGGKVPFEAVFARGATTIFLLSDGAPSTDDWGGSEFVKAPPIVEDVLRMNLLRGCEVHGIAIGTSGADLVEPLVLRVGGRFRAIAPREETSVAEVLRRARELVSKKKREGEPPPDPQALRATLRSTSGGLERARAAHALAVLLGRDAVPDLLEGLGASDEIVREACRREIEALAGTSLGPPAGSTKADRAALERNWRWWWELHPGKPAAPR